MDGATNREVTSQTETKAGTPSAPAAAKSGVLRLADFYGRIALGAAFLSAVADRFGRWGAYGKPHVAWGDFAHFTQYTGMVNSFLPARMIPAVAWAATIAETAFGIGLILGIYKRAITLGSAILLLLFALAMAISFGIKTPLDYSVFSASAAALLLFALEQNLKSEEKEAPK